MNRKNVCCYTQVSWKQGRLWGTVAGQDRASRGWMEGTWHATGLGLAVRATRVSRGAGGTGASREVTPRHLPSNTVCIPSSLLPSRGSTILPGCVLISDSRREPHCPPPSWHLPEMPGTPGHQQGVEAQIPLCFLPFVSQTVPHK